jgi:hypothetical protein
MKVFVNFAFAFSLNFSSGNIIIVNGSIRMLQDRRGRVTKPAQSRGKPQEQFGFASVVFYFGSLVLLHWMQKLSQ